MVRVNDFFRDAPGMGGGFPNMRSTTPPRQTTAATTQSARTPSTGTTSPSQSPTYTAPSPIPTSAHAQKFWNGLGMDSNQRMSPEDLVDYGQAMGNKTPVGPGWFPSGEHVSSYNPNLDALQDLAASLLPNPSSEYFNNNVLPRFDQQEGWNQQRQGLNKQLADLLGQTYQNNLGVRGLQRDREMFPNNQTIQNFGRDKGLLGDQRGLSRDQASSQQQSQARNRGYQATAGGAGGYLNTAHRADLGDYRTQRDQSYRGADLTYRGGMNTLNDRLSQANANVGFINRDYGLGTTQDRIGYDRGMVNNQNQSIGLDSALAQIGWNRDDAVNKNDQYDYNQIEQILSQLLGQYPLPQPGYAVSSTG